MSAAKRSRSARGPGFLIDAGAERCVWVLDGENYNCEIMPGACPFCLVVAVTELPPPLLAMQPDGTTHVCHPALGGCNHGFADTRGGAR